MCIHPLAAGCQKVSKSDFQREFSMSRNIQISLNFFSLQHNFCKNNFFIFWIDIVVNCQKVSKSDFQNQFSTSKIKGICLIFFSFKNTYQLKKFLIISIFETLDFLNDAKFLTTRQKVISQNTIISFEDIDFWLKTFLILYPSFEKSTTHITILTLIVNFFGAIFVTR